MINYVTVIFSRGPKFNFTTGHILGLDSPSIICIHVLRKRAYSNDFMYINFRVHLLQVQHFFDDPDGKIELPASLKVDHWQRPQDYITEKVNISHFVLCKSVYRISQDI